MEDKNLYNKKEDYSIKKNVPSVSKSNLVLTNDQKIDQLIKMVQNVNGKLEENISNKKMLKKDNNSRR